MYRRDLSRVEVWGVLLVVAVALLAPRRRWRLPSLRGWRAWAAVGLVALIVRLLVLLILPLPYPIVHDEFSFLLQADTFAHGRLTNPTHPFWMHFETMHVIQQPSYNSMYFPVQGLILALGQILGHPWIGVWLSCVAMCAALTWMLQAWLPPRWALLGGLIAVARIGTFSYWTQGYWGGAHAMLGGALVLGGLGRLLKKPRAVDAALMALGMVILAGGRPYEGVLLCVPVGLLFLWRLGRRPALLASVTLVLALGAVGLGYYCWRVTGSPFKPPYQVNRETYGWPTTLAFLPVPDVSQRHPQMRHHYLIESSFHEQYQSGSRTLIEAMVKAVAVWSFYLGPALTVPLLMLPWMLRDRRVRFLLLTLGVGAAGLSLEQTVSPHYAAPFAPALYAVILQLLRHLRQCRWRRVSGAWLVILLPLILPFSVLVRAAQAASLWPVASGDNVYSWCCPPPVPPGWKRAEVIEFLQSMGSRHLVFVRYIPEAAYHEEWVYNGAEIDGQSIVWARDLTPAENRALIRYYPGRRVWLLHKEYRKDPVLEELAR